MCYKVKNKTNFTSYFIFTILVLINFSPYNPNTYVIQLKDTESEYVTNSMWVMSTVSVRWQKRVHELARFMHLYQSMGVMDES